MPNRVIWIAANRHSLEIGQDLLEQSKRRRHACWGNLLTPLNMINQHPENAAILYFSPVLFRHAEAGLAAATALLSATGHDALFSVGLRRYHLVGPLSLNRLRLRLGLLRHCPLLRLIRTSIAIASCAARLSRRSHLAPPRFLLSELTPWRHDGFGQRRVVGDLQRAHGASSI